MDSCAGCVNERPELDQENAAAWELWCLVSTQWRTAVGEQIVWLGLDFTAVCAIAAAAEIEMCPALIGQLKQLEMAYLKKMNKKGG